MSLGYGIAVMLYAPSRRKKEAMIDLRVNVKAAWFLMIDLLLATVEEYLAILENCLDYVRRLIPNSSCGATLFKCSFARSKTQQECLVLGSGDQKTLQFQAYELAHRAIY